MLEIFHPGHGTMTTFYDVEGTQWRCADKGIEIDLFNPGLLVHTRVYERPTQETTDGEMAELILDQFRAMATQGAGVWSFGIEPFEGGFFLIGTGPFDWAEEEVQAAAAIKVLSVDGSTLVSQVVLSWALRPWDEATRASELDRLRWLCEHYGFADPPSLPHSPGQGP